MTIPMLIKRPLCLVFVGLAWAITSASVAAEPEPIFQATKRLGPGINLGNFLEVPKEDNWAINLRPEHLKVIADAGFRHIRMPVKWSNRSQTTSPYTIDPQFFSRIDGLLAAAEQNHLNVVLNIHHFYELDQAPAANSAWLVGLWQQIADRYKAKGDWLYFEMNNEPHEKLDDATWNAIVPLALAAIRQSNPTRPVIIGPANWNSAWSLPKLELPADSNLIVTFHSYNPFEFTHQGTEWSEPKFRDNTGVVWSGTQDEAKAMDDEFRAASEWAKLHNRPLYLGEFGAYHRADDESRERWTRAVRAAAEKYDMAWCYWEFAAGFSAYDLSTNRWREPLRQALLGE